MASSDVAPDLSSDSENSEASETESETEYNLGVEGSQNSSDQEDPDKLEPEEAYSDEPLADEEWLALYEKEMKIEQQLEKKLKKRLRGTVEVREWCQCGKCELEFLQNISECYCCSELDGCVEALVSDIVLQDLPDGTKLKCVTQHPGFNAVCLQKWSLRLAAGKYRTKSKTKYRQTGSEESFLRSVAYREFSRLIYDFLGNKRIPLPACAYTEIRRAFPCAKDEEYSGFDIDDEDK